MGRYRIKLRQVVGVFIKSLFRPAIKYTKRTLSNNYHPAAETFSYTIGKYAGRLKGFIKLHSPRRDPSEANDKPTVGTKEPERSRVVEHVGRDLLRIVFLRLRIRHLPGERDKEDGKAGQGRSRERSEAG